MIQVEHVVVRLGGRRILNGVDLHAKPGEVTMLFGPNGAGKTTTLRTINGLVRPESGAVRVADCSLAEQRDKVRRQVSYLPQGVRFQPRLPVRALVRFYGSLRGVPVPRQEALLGEWGLADVGRQRAGTLSGGMRQRLGIVVLLLPDAPVLLLDEPGLSLDPVWRDRMKQCMREEARRGRTVLLATHLVDEWTDHADAAIWCDQGRVEKTLKPSDAWTVAQMEEPSAS